jgi:hypothetical protein
MGPTNVDAQTPSRVVLGRRDSVAGSQVWSIETEEQALGLAVSIGDWNAARKMKGE